MRLFVMCLCVGGARVCAHSRVLERVRQTRLKARVSVLGWFCFYLGHTGGSCRYLVEYD